jgi:hypothetical protein
MYLFGLLINTVISFDLVVVRLKVDSKIYYCLLDRTI